MCKYFILLLLLSCLYNCGKNLVKSERYMFNIIKLGDKQSTVETRLGNAIRCERNEDGSYTAVYNFKNYKLPINDRMYTKLVILYSSNLNVTHFILD